MDNTIHWLNNYSADSMVCFVNTYPLDRDLSGGQRYLVYTATVDSVECAL